MRSFFVSLIVGGLLSWWLCSCGDGIDQINDKRSNQTADLDASKDDGVTKDTDKDISSIYENQSKNSDLDKSDPKAYSHFEPEDQNQDPKEYVPVGQILRAESTPEIIQGYPYMIIYGGDFCSWCTYLEEKKIKPRLSWFLGRVHVYVVDNQTKTPNNKINGYPLTEFYNKEGSYYTSILGGDDSSWEKIRLILEQLTESTLD